MYKMSKCLSFFIFPENIYFYFECHSLFFYISTNRMAHIFVNSGKDKRNYYPCVSCLYHRQTQTLNLRDGGGWRAETWLPKLHFNCCCSTQLLFLDNSLGVLQVTCHLYCNLQWSIDCKVLWDSSGFIIVGLPSPYKLGGILNICLHNYTNLCYAVRTHPYSSWADISRVRNLKNLELNLSVLLYVHF